MAALAPPAAVSAAPAVARRARQPSPAKNWCFTENNPPHQLELEGFGDNLQYIVWSLEVGEEGTPHYQGYLQLKEKMRESAIKRIWPRAHLAVARGSPESNRTYCTKLRTHVEGPWEHGTLLPGQGSRSDLHEMAAAVAAGKKMREVAQDTPELVVRYSRGIQVLESVASRVAAEGETRDPYVYVLWGAPGTGKTLLPHSLYSEADIFTYHLIPGGHQWFDGYDGQPVLIIDDFTGWVPFRTLLMWLDRYPLRLEVKGGFTYARWHRVFITSNRSPEEWYHSADADYAALERRIGYVWHFPEDLELARTVTQGTLYTRSG